MTAPTDDNLLARLAGGTSGSEGPNPWAGLDAKEPQHDSRQPAARSRDPKLDALLGRVRELTEAAEGKPQAADPAPPAEEDHNPFLPIEPGSFAQAGLSDTEVEALVLKFLLARGDASGREIADQVKLPFVPIDALLRQMKTDQLVVHKGAAPMNDYQYLATDFGRERARRYSPALHVFRVGPGFAGRLHRLGRGPVAHQATPERSRPPPGVCGTAAQ